MSWTLVSALAPGMGHAGYVRPGETRIVSVPSDGSQGHTMAPTGTPVFGCGECHNDISAAGRYVAFASYASNLVTGDDNQTIDVFVHDLKTKRTELVSKTATGTPAFGACADPATNQPPFVNVRTGSWDPAISADGRFVAFQSCAWNLSTIDDKLSEDVFVHDRATGRTELVSIASDSAPAACAPGMAAECSEITHGSISADGRYVAFLSNAPNLVPGDTNQWYDAFVHDRKTGATELVSVSSQGQQAQGGVLAAPIAINADGRYITFKSTSDNLVTDDTNGPFVNDVFVHDRETARTERVNVASDGSEEGFTQVGGQAYFGEALAISARGRYVSFPSLFGGFVPNDANNTYDIFVHDRKTGETERVSVSPSGSEADSYSGVGLAVSGDGRYVAFGTQAHIAPDDDQGGACQQEGLGLVTCGKRDWDVYVHDRLTGATELVSRYHDGTTHCEPCGSQEYSRLPTLAASGRLVAFLGHADALVEADGNGEPDTFVRDIGPALGAGAVTRGPLELRSTRPVLRHLVDSSSDAEAAAGAELLGARLVYRPLYSDLFVKIGVDRIPGPRGGVAGLPAAGNPVLVYGFRFTLDGHAYEVRAWKGPGPASFGLFACDRACTEVAPLEGGYGTLGESIASSIPLHVLRAEPEDHLSDLHAFSAYGTYSTGPVRILDEVMLGRN